eukprot:365235-Chlamydomonas_euryale.AAC.4
MRTASITPAAPQSRPTSVWRQREGWAGMQGGREGLARRHRGIATCLCASLQHGVACMTSAA